MPSAALHQPTGDGAEGGTQLLWDRNPPHLGRQAPFTNTEHKVAGRHKKQQQNSYPPVQTPRDHSRLSPNPTDPQQHHQAPPTPPGRAPHFRAINHSRTPQKHRRDPHPQQGSAAILRTAAGGLCWHSNVPLQDEVGGRGGYPLYAGKTHGRAGPEKQECPDKSLCFTVQTPIQLRVSLPAQPGKHTNTNTAQPQTQERAP